MPIMCSIWDWMIQETLLTHNWLRVPVHFIVPSTGSTQNRFWEFGYELIIDVFFFLNCPNTLVCNNDEKGKGGVAGISSDKLNRQVCPWGC